MVEISKPNQTRRRTFLREWRKFRGLNQEAAADRLDIDRTTLSKIERGVIPYNQDLLERMADSYTCEVSDLLMVDPHFGDGPRLVFDRLRSAPENVQKRAIAVLEALLKGVVAKSFGLDLDSGSSLFRLAKSRAFVAGSLDGILIRCGAKVQIAGFEAMAKSFSLSEFNELFAVRKAALYWSHAKVESDKPSAEACLKVLKLSRITDQKMAKDFEP